MTQIAGFEIFKNLEIKLSTRNILTDWLMEIRLA